MIYNLSVDNIQIFYVISRDPDEVLLDAMKIQKIFHQSHSEFFYGKSETNENNETNENIKSSAFDFSGQNKNI